MRERESLGKSDEDYYYCRRCKKDFAVAFLLLILEVQETYSE
jgi:hypothetical protein